MRVQKCIEVNGHIWLCYQFRSRSGLLVARVSWKTNQDGEIEVFNIAVIEVFNIAVFEVFNIAVTWTALLVGKYENNSGTFLALHDMERPLYDVTDGSRDRKP